MEHCFDWAAEMGIDEGLLAREHFSHIDQIRNHRRIARQAEDYWAKQRFIESGGDIAEFVADRIPTRDGGCEWRTIESLAEQFWVHPNTIRNWIKRGLLPERQRGEKMLRVHREDLLALTKPVVPKPRVKRSKVANYEFTDSQYKIARRSLDAGGSV
jgi:hypothetical protein